MTPQTESQARRKPDTPTFWRRLGNTVIAHPLAALIIAGTLVGGAITVTYSTDSSVDTTAHDPPIQYQAGDDAGPSSLTDYVTAYSISTNKTNIDVTLSGVPEAKLVVDSFFKLRNVDDEAHTVTLTTSQVSAAGISTYKIEILDSGDTLQDTLDLTAASPSASTSIPATTTYHAKLTLTLASGATPGPADQDATSSSSIQLTVS